ncbi:MAG: lipopolysaccharide biosynthesis protein [Ignavibacteriales bacterium]
MYLMLTYIFGTGSGFFFWIIAAKLYSSDQIGLAVAIISCMSLISMFSRLGFDVGIIRYLPSTGNKNQMINSCLTITSVVSVLFCILFLAGLDILSPKLIFLRDNISYMIIFILFTVATSISFIQSSVFIALRYSKYSLIQILFATPRILILPLIIMYGLFGMYLAYGMGILAASIIGINSISKIDKTYKFKPSFKKDIFKEIFNYSFKNYISIIFEGIPTYILPLLVVNILGTQQNAYFYIAWCFSSFIQMIPQSTATSLLAEGSNKDSTRKDPIVAIKFIYSLLLPVIVVVFLFGKYILLIFGGEYSANSFNLLKILSIASIPFTLNIIYISIKRIERHIEPVIYMYSFLGIFSIVFSILLVKWLGLNGIGVSWLLVNSILVIIIWKDIFKLLGLTPQTYIDIQNQAQ